jgi:drug/metabolite transporter (DMT)-like permease
MSHRPFTFLLVLCAVLGAGALAYVIAAVPPYDDGGTLSAGALLAFFASLFLLCAALGALCAQALHRRWPSLAGRRQRLRPGTPPGIEPALRQGILFGLVVATLMALSILRLLDVTFAIVTVLLGGLVEAYAQSRP